MQAGMPYELSSPLFLILKVRHPAINKRDFRVWFYWEGPHHCMESEIFHQ